MNISEHLSELEALRKERGMSQQELAETCGGIQGHDLPRPEWRDGADGKACAEH